jgi:hypothetical protein
VETVSVYEVTFPVYGPVVTRPDPESPDRLLVTLSLDTTLICGLFEDAFGREVSIQWLGTVLTHSRVPQREASR